MWKKFKYWITNRWTERRLYSMLLKELRHNRFPECISMNPYVLATLMMDSDFLDLFVFDFADPHNPGYIGRYFGSPIIVDVVIKTGLVAMEYPDVIHYKYHRTDRS